MHELAVTTSLLELAIQHAKTVHASHISHLYLVVGQLSSVIDDSVTFYWNIVCKDSIAEGSQLHFRRIPAQFQCSDCQVVYPLKGDDFTCPSCGSERIHIIAGEEFYLESIGVETDEEPQTSVTGNAS